jgi:hypothetical protein
MAGTSTSLTNSPRHMAKARVAVPVARAFASVEWQFIGSSPRCGANCARVRLSWSAVDRTESWLTGSIRNLFNQLYSDPGSNEHLPDSIQRTGRTARIGFRWTIGAR